MGHRAHGTRGTQGRMVRELLLLMLMLLLMLLLLCRWMCTYACNDRGWGGMGCATPQGHRAGVGGS